MTHAQIAADMSDVEDDLVPILDSEYDTDNLYADLPTIQPPKTTKAKVVIQPSVRKFLSEILKILKALITFIIPEGITEASKIMVILHDITFKTFKATIHVTYGCTDLKLKLELTYKIGTLGHIHLLTDDNNFSLLMKSKELTSKKCIDVKVFIVISKKVHHDFHSSFDALYFSSVSF